MARNSGTSTVPSATPAATRATPPGWRDPRMWIGVAIVAVSVVAGAQLLSAADDTVSVWSVGADLGAGDALTADDLVAERVRFADETRLADYYTVDDSLPADLTLIRGVGAGELLPRSAVGSADEAGTLQVPLAVDATQVPGSVEAGSVVDVYLVAAAVTSAAAAPAEPQPSPSPGGGSGGGSGSGEAGAGGPALSEVTVVDAPSAADGFGASGQRQLVLAVAEEDAQRFFALLGSTENAVVTVVRRS